MKSNFHSVGQNLFKLISVLKNGIVSERYSKNIPSYSRNFGGYNGNDFISLSKYGTQSFKQYSQTGFSLMVSPEIFCIDANKTNHDSGIPGEVFYRGVISSEYLKAIICPENLIDLQIKDLKFMQDIGYGFADSIARNILEQMGIEEDSKERQKIELLIKEKGNPPEGLGVLEVLDYEKKYISKIDAELAEMIHIFFSQKLNKEDVTVRDIMYKVAEKYNIPVFLLDKNDKMVLCYQSQLNESNQKE